MQDSLQSLILKKLERLIEVAKQGLKDLKKQVFVFEHGPCSPSQSTGCGIDHLHYHVVPLEFNLFEKTKQYSPFIWNSATLLSTKEFFLKQRSYLYIQCPSGEKYIATDLNIPSQFFRRVIAKELNIENYFDWKQNFGTENIDKTIKILSNQSRTHLIWEEYQIQKILIREHLVIGKANMDPKL
ncbi:MAG: hypothetical protein WKG06_07275 [Segetibacter sp.]